MPVVAILGYHGPSGAIIDGLLTDSEATIPSAEGGAAGVHARSDR